MTAEPCTTARPAWALSIWLDHGELFIEMPVKDSIPYILRMPYTPTSIIKLLGTIQATHDKLIPPTNGRVVDMTTHPTIKRAPKPTVEFTDDQRGKVMEMLRRKGMV